MAALRLVSCENKEATDTRGRGVMPEYCSGHTDAADDNDDDDNNNNKGLELFVRS
jgi:hypothetical protein